MKTKIVKLSTFDLSWLTKFKKLLKIIIKKKLFFTEKSMLKINEQELIEKKTSNGQTYVQIVKNLKMLSITTLYSQRIKKNFCISKL